MPIPRCGTSSRKKGLRRYRANGWRSKRLSEVLTGNRPASSSGPSRFAGPRARPPAGRGDSHDFGMQLREQIDEAVGYILMHTRMLTENGIILGTGLGGLVIYVCNDRCREFDKITHCSVS